MLLYVLIYVLIHVVDCESNAVLVCSNVCAVIFVMSVVLECRTVCSNNCPHCKVFVFVAEGPAVSYHNVGCR